MSLTQRIAIRVLPQLRQLGWAGALGLALAAFAAAFWFSGAVPAQRQLAEDRAALEELRTGLARTGQIEPGPRQRVSRYYAAFPARSDLPLLLLRLHGYALARGVVSQRADYREGSDTGTPLQRVVVTLPVKGQFPQIRSWLADVLAELPQVGLEELRISRENIGTDALEAEARFAVYLRRGT